MPYSLRNDGEVVILHRKQHPHGRLWARGSTVDRSNVKNDVLVAHCNLEHGMYYEITKGLCNLAIKTPKNDLWNVST